MNGKYARTHHSLITAGITLFFENGFDQTTIHDICEKVGISRPTFYIHFSSKDQLAYEYYESSHYFSEETEKWVLDAGNPWASIIRLQMVNIQNTCNPEHAELIARYLAYKLTGSSKASTASTPISKISDLQMGLIARAQKEGIITNKADPFYLNNTVFMLNNGNLFQWCSTDGRFDRYAGFFWSLEAIFSVKDEYKSLWKLSENMMPMLY